MADTATSPPPKTKPRRTQALTAPTPPTPHGLLRGAINDAANVFGSASVAGEFTRPQNWWAQWDHLCKLAKRDLPNDEFVKLVGSGLTQIGTPSDFPGAPGAALEKIGQALRNIDIVAAETAAPPQDPPSVPPVATGAAPEPERNEVPREILPGPSLIDNMTVTQAGAIVEAAMDLHPTATTPIGTMLRHTDGSIVTVTGAGGEADDTDTKPGEIGTRREWLVVKDNGREWDLDSSEFKQWEVFTPEQQAPADKPLALAPKSSLPPVWTLTQNEYFARAQDYPESVQTDGYWTSIDKAITAGEDIPLSVIEAAGACIALSQIVAYTKNQIDRRDKRNRLITHRLEDAKETIRELFRREGLWEEKKAEATAAKKSFESAQDRLKEIADGVDGEEDMFDDDDETESGTINPTPPAADADAWKAESIDVLDAFGLSASIREKLRNHKTPLMTLGDVQAFVNSRYQDGGLMQVDGIGAAGNDAYGLAFTKWSLANPAKFGGLVAATDAGVVEAVAAVGVLGPAGGIGDELAKAADAAAAGDPDETPAAVPGDLPVNDPAIDEMMKNGGAEMRDDKET